MSLKAANRAVKSLYRKIESLKPNLGKNGLLKYLKKTDEHIVEDAVVFPIYGGFSGTVCTNDEGPLGCCSSVEASVPLKTLYAKIRIPAGAVEYTDLSQTDVENLLQRDMEGLIEKTNQDVSRMLYGDGKGVLATVNLQTGNTLRVTNANGFKAGMLVDIISGTTEEPVVEARRIASVNKSARSILLDGDTLDDGTVTSGDYVVVSGNYGKEIEGFGTVFSNTSETLYGIDLDSNVWLKPYSRSVAEINNAAIQRAIDEITSVGGKVNLIVCSPGVKRAYQEYLVTNGMMPEGGHGNIFYNGIPVVSDVFVPASTMYLLDTDETKIYQPQDWEWVVDSAGNVITEENGQYHATLTKKMALVCERPFALGMIMGITEA